MEKTIDGSTRDVRGGAARPYRRAVEESAAVAATGCGGNACPQWLSVRQRLRPGGTGYNCGGFLASSLRRIRRAPLAQLNLMQLTGSRTLGSHRQLESPRGRPSCQRNRREGLRYAPRGLPSSAPRSALGLLFVYNYGRHGCFSLSVGTIVPSPERGQVSA